MLSGSEKQSAVLFLKHRVSGPLTGALYWYSQSWAEAVAFLTLFPGDSYTRQIGKHLFLHNVGNNCASLVGC